MDPTCGKVGKHPRLRDWQRRASRDPVTINEWWDQWPDANVGILTGPRSGVVALDVDPRSGGDDALVELERKYSALPQTVSVVTGGGGQHYYFVAPNVELAKKLVDGLDLQGEGRLLVAPPSVHVSGRRYEWDDPPTEVPLAEMPAWLLSRVTRRRRRAKIAGAIPQGSRNVALTSIAGAMRLTMPYAEGIAAALHAVNRERCRPPLPRPEVERIARSAQRWHALPWLTSPREFFADERLDITSRAVLRAICDHANSDGVASVTHQTITRLTGIKSHTTISKSVARLEETKRIAVQRAFKRPNVYRVNRALSALFRSRRGHPRGT